MRVVLASASPRRRELLARLGVHAEVRPADVDETIAPGEGPVAAAVRLARAKAAAVPCGVDEVVIAADTIVAIDGHLLGKPVDAADAADMLRRLAGREHEVVTGVAVRTQEATVAEAATTHVRFRSLGEDEIAWYVGTGEPADKAGAYAIQGAAGAFVTEIHGSDTNVVGLPLQLVVALARQVGRELLTRTSQSRPSLH